MEYKSQNVVCQNCKKDFTIEPEDFNFYEKIKVSPPTWCPECRAIRRLIWRNERSLYHNTCAFSGKSIISMFSPETKLVVYDRDIWWSDKWDPFDYGMDYDFSKPFFEQFQELLKRVPLANLGNTNMVNSDYANHCLDCRNCFLLYASITVENVLYSTGMVNVKDSLDLYKIIKSEQCYEDVLCGSIFNTHFSYDSDECINSIFLTSCLNLQDCLGCVNLRHKSHCVFNKQYSKEEYEKIRASYNLDSYIGLEKFKKKYAEFLKTQFRRFAFIYKSINVTGDNMIHSKNGRMLFDIFGELENSKYVCHVAAGLKESYDGYGAGAHAEFMYESIDTGVEGSRQLFSIINHSCLATHYTYMCYSSKFLFGCIGVRNRDYAILNKKYTKDEYEKLLPKIIKHMQEMPYTDTMGRVYKYGEFFPMELSPFSYNETIIQEYYPLDKKTVFEYGLKWKEISERDYKIEIKSEDLPDHIKDVDESIVGKVIECMHKGECNQQCTEAFKIREDELKFYKKINIALPRLCPNCRHFERLKKRNPMKLWHRQCMCDPTSQSYDGQSKINHFHGKEKCTVEFETSYAPDRPEIVYCEKCYQQEVY
ncbi:hypothetical protein A3B85_01700 [Candidatus Nomurabacteria bacterium RIFCSPHIGHO2_02_FULL_37_13]|uniref:Uncharacterized protein n=1 Tax=Candidatus Nomurabacteria bacterium RIFCSPHIGHO2_02_FULL_37_13 TaxID=1801750 RepID=A0A1F6W5F2_9BACT|nr:MAG: hypothetical protein A2640_03020 [Candidatus Nomurabacteria bacterium RIFCSPHIGHO2_01_FULL_36_23]OGI77140.1 MAG: hypothetical protein A3B85_01700 [Candidatus Nomurabacteria bacterium RIFCSPHIGHO2_02_FULL_37_13]OGI88219.1 MAG: hypothetical protein A2906_01535 [Candidatus Nomurabacteria bacterium RIFCSPLOWO2_01_FULL_37_25]